MKSDSDVNRERSRNTDLANSARNTAVPADARGSKVSFAGETVILSGTLRSWRGRDAGQGIACSAPRFGWVVAMASAPLPI
jgi:hypothetical protein